MTNAYPLEGKLALVSGSARGIGAAICRELASRGAQVVVNYPWPAQKAEAEEVLKQLREIGAPAAAKSIMVEADLSTLDGPKFLVDETIKQTGRDKIDILVNNAAVGIMVPLKDITLEQWDWQINLNCRGLMLLTQATLKHLARQSRIVNLSSVGAREGYPGATVYNGTKSMVENFTRCWAKELGPEYECTVNAVCPGPTNTVSYNDATPEFHAMIKGRLETTPMGNRMGKPEDIAYAVGALCDPAANWISGVCLGTNGGFLMT
ncbi:hypothetical protein ACHAPT_011963 [Fusarium lateritium]